VIERTHASEAIERLAIIRHVQDVTGDVAKTCRHYGISRPRYYRWLQRYQEEGLEGLRDRSSRPFRSPRTTKAEVVAQIVYLRENRRLGPHKIAAYLKCYHGIEISGSGVWLVLKRLGMNRLPSSATVSEASGHRLVPHPHRTP